MSAAARVVDAVKTYASEGEEPVHALAGVSFAIGAGEMVALVGPSGCGKSTLLNLIGCIDLPSSGTVEVDGRATSRLGDDALTALRRDRVGTVFQFFNLLPSLSVAENVALPLVLQKRPRKEVDERVAAALDTEAIYKRDRRASLSFQHAALPRSLPGANCGPMPMPSSTANSTVLRS